jgi:hypothetical protein
MRTAHTFEQRLAFEECQQRKIEPARCLYSKHTEVRGSNNFLDVVGVLVSCTSTVLSLSLSACMPDNGGDEQTRLSLQAILHARAGAACGSLKQSTVHTSSISTTSAPQSTTTSIYLQSIRYSLLCLPFLSGAPCPLTNTGLSPSPLRNVFVLLQLYAIV